MDTKINNTMPIYYQDATTLAKMIRNKEVSPVEVVQAHLDRIEKSVSSINAIVIIADTVIKAAKAAETAVMKGERLGSLHGVPFTAQDSIDTANLLTQRGSPIFKDRVPGADATSVARLKAAGAILLAKTNLPEFSYWIESEHLLSGRSNNPWDLTKTPEVLVVKNQPPLQRVCHRLDWELILQSCRWSCRSDGNCFFESYAWQYFDDRYMVPRTTSILAYVSHGKKHP